MQAGLQGLEQLAPELAASTANAMGAPRVAQPPGPSQEAGPSHDSEQPSGEQPEVSFQAWHVNIARYVTNALEFPLPWICQGLCGRPGPHTTASSPQASNLR